MSSLRIADPSTSEGGLRWPKATWQTRDGRVRLYLGDCLKLLPRLSSAEAVITDPPYSSGGQFRGDRANRNTREKYQTTPVATEHPTFTGDNRDQRSWVRWMTLWLLDAKAVAKPGAMLCTFTDWRQLPATTDAVQASGWLWLGIVPWDKVNARPMANRFSAQAEYIVWGTNGPSAQAEYIVWGTNGRRSYSLVDATYHAGVVRAMPPRGRVHSTQKPIEVIERLTAIVRVDGLVLDPFMGSGTTGVAAVQSGRRFVGIELDPGYFETAKQRIQAALKAERQAAAAESRRHRLPG